MDAEIGKGICRKMLREEKEKKKTKNHKKRLHFLESCPIIRIGRWIGQKDHS